MRKRNMRRERTIMRDNLRHLDDPFVMFFNNVTDVHDIEGVLLVVRGDHGSYNVHIFHRVVKDFELVEVVKRHVNVRWTVLVCETSATNSPREICGYTEK